jgi:hypothetical protein
VKAYKELICPACGTVFQTSGTAARRKKYCDRPECKKTRKAAHDRANYQKNVRPKDLDGLTHEEIETQRREKISAGNTGKVRTSGARAKNAEQAKKKWADGTFKGVPHTPEAKEKIRQATLRQYAEGRVNQDGLALGRNRTTEERSAAWTDEKRAAQAARTLTAYQDGRMRVYGRYGSSWHIYDGPKGIIPMRSRSETIFAYDLDAQGLDWLYEPERFDLGWCTYSPDFYLPAFDRWVEVKGYWTELAQHKVEEFGESHLISVVHAADLLRLERVNV